MLGSLRSLGSATLASQWTFSETLIHLGHYLHNSPFLFYFFPSNDALNLMKVFLLDIFCTYKTMLLICNETQM